MSVSQNFSWTDEKVAELKRLHPMGYSASIIRDMIGAPTRNVVIGKITRLGLSRAVPVIARENPRYRPASERKAEREKTPALKPPAKQNLHAGNIAKKAAKKAEERQAEFVALADKALERFDAVSIPPESSGDVVVPFSERVTIMDLREYMCRWPMGDPTTPEFRFCGARSSTGRPYCAYHARVAYQPPALREFKDRQFAKGLKA